MQTDTLVLRKEGHWFVLGAPPERNRRQEMILSLLQVAESRSFDVDLDQVDDLARSLGWTTAIRRGNLGAA